MGLSHLIFKEETVKFPGGEFVVRGLSADHVTFIVKHHKTKLNDLFDRVLAKMQDPEGTVGAQEVGGYILPFIDEVPEVVAQVIACAAGDPRETALAARLPFPVQIEALEKILALTFDAEGGPKKLLETVIRLTRGTTSLLTDLSA